MSHFKITDRVIAIVDVSKWIFKKKMVEVKGYIVSAHSDFTYDVYADNEETYRNVHFSRIQKYGRSYLMEDNHEHRK